MKKYTVIIFGVALFCSLFLINSKAFADNIGFIDMQKILMSYDEAKNAEVEFKKKQDDYQKQFDEKQVQIEKAKTDKKSDAEIKELITRLEKELEPKKQELIRLNQELTTKLRTKIFTAAEAVSKEYGLDIILDRQVVLIGGFDVTDFVLKKLNSKK
ncbi:MAG: OmpH family outer membrane protein [Candidatus Margulisiibacteriota bacterium]|jgi:outer membrane protein